jgi:hypothetical protein
MPRGLKLSHLLIVNMMLFVNTSNFEMKTYLHDNL